MTRLLLVRHGETEWNRTQRVQGQYDSALNEAGRRQAERVGRRLAGEEPQAAVLFASDLQRALHTAEAIAAHHPAGLAIRQDPRLRELMLGSWETRCWPEIEEAEPELVARWRYDVSSVTPPGGEPMTAMAARLGEFLAEVTAAYPDQTVLVATHGGAIRMMIALAMECPLRMSWRFGTDNTSIAELLLSKEGPFLMRLNDTRHLDGLEESGANEDKLV